MVHLISSFPFLLFPHQNPEDDKIVWPHFSLAWCPNHHERTDPSILEIDGPAVLQL